jgi:peptidoglycan/LPS O-acetylase OafA/YrhL
MPVVVLVHSFLFRSLKQESLLPFIATLAVAVAVAYAFSFVFERPALALSKMWKIKRSRQPAAAPA